MDNKGWHWWKLRDDLAAGLPAHMRLGTFNLIEQLPLTINGKVDFRALPEPQWIDSKAYVGPMRIYCSPVRPALSAVIY